MNLTIFGFTDIVLSLQETYLANFFAMLITFSFMIVTFVMRNYNLPKSFYAFLVLLTSSLYLIVYAGDYLLFFIGWEIMSISSYFLLSYTLSKEALIKYIVFAIASALSMFMAILILYSQNHSFLYADISASFEMLNYTYRFLFIGLMLFAIFVKLGVIGFHYWLVDAYEQSHHIFTPFLSAILSKMGVYALIVLVTNITQASFILAIMGVLTSVIATFKAIQEDCVKRLLAYSSMAQLGYIVTVLGVSDGMSGALYHSLIHTVVKLLLFINIAGIIYITNRSKLSQLGGLIYKTPQSFVLLLIGIIALAGMPPLGGFSSKFMIYTSLLDANHLLLLSAVMFSSASAFLYIYKLIYGIYLGHPTNKKLETIKEVPLVFLLPQYILAFILIVLGMLPALVVPYFNKILSQLHQGVIPYINMQTLITPFSQFNGLVVIGAFCIILVIILAIFINIRSKAKDVKDRFDIAYCAEVPTQATHLHYGDNIGKELKRVGFVKVILDNSVKYFYDFISRQIFFFSDFLRKIYSGNLSLNFNIAIIFLIILLWGGLR